MPHDNQKVSRKCSQYRMRSGHILKLATVGMLEKVAGAAPITTVTPPLPTDFGPPIDDSAIPIFPETTDPTVWLGQFNEIILALCYMAADVMNCLCSTVAGQTYLRSIIQQATDATGKPIPGRVVAFFKRSGTWQGVIVDYSASGKQDPLGPTPALFWTIITHAYAYLRNGLNTLDSEQWGLTGSFAPELGLTMVANPNSTAAARALAKAGHGLQMSTGPNTSRADIPKSHALAFAPESQQPIDTNTAKLTNPWGEFSNAGGVLNPVISNADITAFGYWFSAYAPPVADPLLPISGPFVSGVTVPTVPPATSSVPTSKIALPNPKAESNSVIRVSWDTGPLGSDPNGVTGIHVYSPAGGPLVATLGPKETQYVAQNLTANTSYTFSIKAFNGNGDGPDVIVSATTLGGIVTPPNSTGSGPTVLSPIAAECSAKGMPLASAWFGRQGL